MWEQYAPDPAMRLNLGIRRRLAPLLDNDRRKIELANSLLFTLPGSPIIYYGDEIGMGDNIGLPDRNGVRTPMQWDSTSNAGFTSAKPYAPVLAGEYAPQRVNVVAQMADQASLFHAISRMIRVRKAHPTIGTGTFAWVNDQNPAVAIYEHEDPNETLLMFHNLSDHSQTVDSTEFRGVWSDLLEGASISVGASLALAPFKYLWLARA
jgi:maltose alpha-D-glucosyltransferase/alpha-amylase